jgi:hypothetical protein
MILFSLALIGGAALTTFKLTAKTGHELAESLVVDPHDKSRSVHAGPWGELITRDIELERPVEFLNAEVSAAQPETWKFMGMKTAAVKALLMQDGLTAAQTAALLAPGVATEDAAGTRVVPPADFLLNLDAATRGRLYPALAGRGINVYLDYPYIFPGDLINSIYASPQLNSDDLALFKKLVYNNGTAQQMSDYELLLARIPTTERRVAMAKALSRQHAVLASLAINANTDIDKLLGYWSNVPNVRFTDARPLMEALKALPEGGNLPLFYVLPKFARDRLYTFPLPARPGDAVLDCHWTTFNFSNDTPDNRFNDPSYAVQYIGQNYYQISAPSLYGDVLLLMNDKNEIKHSAMFLADDLVFTKNGNNYRQPWMIMHIPDLLATYPATPPMHAVYIRNKVD